MNEQYDRNAMLRQFKPGNQVQCPQREIFRSICGGPKSVWYSTPEWQRKTRPCHVNMLKLYLSRKSLQEKHNPPAMSLVSADADDGLKVILVDRQGGKLTNSDFLREDESCLSYLPDDQRCDVLSLFSDFPHTVQGRQADALSRG